MAKKRGKETLYLNNYSVLRNKKALSDIVATLIIILLVIVAAGIIWVVVRNVIQSGAGQIEFSEKCMGIGFTGISLNDESGGTYRITITRTGSGTNDPAAGLKIILFNDTHNSGVLDFDEEFGKLTTRTKILPTPNNLINVNKMEYTAYFRDDAGREQVCPMTSTVFIIAGQGIIGNGGNGEEPPPGGDGCEPLCEAGYICENGACVLVEGGEGAECEVDGDCSVGFECISNSCTCKYAEPEYACSSEYLEYECGTAYVCGVLASCGTCEFGEFCSSHLCVTDNVINSGVVQDVFTASEPFQFSSPSLPYWYDLNLQNKYVNFSTLEGVCSLIRLHHRVEDEEHVIDYVVLDDVVVGLTPGLDYTVWNVTQCGLVI